MMNIEQTILNNLKQLSPEKQQEVLNLTQNLMQPKLPSPNPNLTPAERAEKWRKVMAKLPQTHANLPDEALHRDTMYDE